MVEEKEQDWYFDFLTSDEERSGKYVVIHGTFGSAREIMVKHFGTHWAFQNTEEYFTKNFPKWMQKIELPDEG